MMPRRMRLSASGFTSGTTSGTSGSMRNWLVLSITMQPAAAARGACMADTAAPGLNRPMSQPAKSNLSRLCTVSTRLSANDTCDPAERPEATAAMSSIGKSRSARVFSISRPTAPVAPTTATLYPMTQLSDAADPADRPSTSPSFPQRRWQASHARGRRDPQSGHALPMARSSTARCDAAAVSVAAWMARYSDTTACPASVSRAPPPPEPPAAVVTTGVPR